MKNQSEWTIKKVDERSVTALVRGLNVPRVAAATFAARGLDTPERVAAFAYIGMEALHDPMLLPDMPRAVERLSRAIDAGERVHIHADADADGITAAAVLVGTLRRLGVQVTYQIASRYKSGYGIKAGAVRHAHSQGVQVFVALDTGTSDVEAAECAREIGLDFIIADHHQPSTDRRLPSSTAFVNPRRLDSLYPFAYLCSVGIAYKMMLALAVERGHCPEKVTNHLCDLAAVGIVCDAAPLTGENRVLVAMGAERIAAGKRAGLQALMRVAGVKQVDARTIGFGLGPRLNAAARLMTPSVALELLLTDDMSQAIRIAERLEQEYRWRRARQEAMLQEALAWMTEGETTAAVPIVPVETWHPGVANLAARQLMELLDRPAVVLTSVPEKDGTIRATCRSNGTLDIIAALDAPGCREHLSKCGGNERAAFFEANAETMPLVAARLNALAEAAPARVTMIDALIRREEISVSTMDAISRLAPYGQANPEPIFLAQGLVVLSTRAFSNRRHLELRLEGSSEHLPCIRAIGWNRGRDAERFPPGSAVDAVIRLRDNHYEGRRFIEAVIEDIRLAESRPARHQRNIALIQSPTNGHDRQNGHQKDAGAVRMGFIPRKDMVRQVARGLRLQRKGFASTIPRPRFHRTDLRNPAAIPSVATAP
ncbi:MAG TPA: single-stranded-DNA-specific exonuclease RecJ [Chthonomonadaceae bacterium]|nr:single-stranded-DNA-specific exonuclease RecJ [Chthonomonadaceae bacterium]